MIKNPLQRKKTQFSLFGAAVALLAASGALAQTTEPEQMTGIGEWETDAVFTIGESVNGYTPPGIPDGMGAFKRGRNIEVIANHELRSAQGYPYTLANGATLTGARVSSFMLNPKTGVFENGELAYDIIYNRAGNEVFGPEDLEFGGLNRLCSAGSFKKGQAGFVDDIFLTGEETGGGTEFALDVRGNVLYAAPWMGRAAWESVAALELSKKLNKKYVAILVGDDREAAPLLLYVGKKQRGNDFLARNGLAEGKLYVWVANNGDIDPEDWNGTFTGRAGKFVEIPFYRPELAGTAGYDELGFADQDTQDALAEAAGAFKFSRPEDVHTNPDNGYQAVLASTGRGGRFPSDNWGTTYIVDVDIDRRNIKRGDIPAHLFVIYDGDDAGAGQFSHPDSGMRSPDNLVWANDGYVYLQEDRSTVVRVPKDPAGCAAAADPADCEARAFGGASGEEASLWKLDPESGDLTRIAQVDRTAVPAGQIDTDPLDLGDWETSGVIDISGLVKADDDETVLFINAQAHSLRGGPIDELILEQGGQFLLLSGEVEDDDDGDDDKGRGRGRDKDDDDDDEDDDD
jgi:hypothetical protein